MFWGTPAGSEGVLTPSPARELWSFNVGTGIVAPITWEQNGEQYVAVVAGWGGAVPLWGGDVAKRVNYLEQGGSVWAFKLHKEFCTAPPARSPFGAQGRRQTRVPIRASCLLFCAGTWQGGRYTRPADQCFERAPESLSAACPSPPCGVAGGGERPLHEPSWVSGQAASTLRERLVGYQGRFPAPIGQDKTCCTIWISRI